jgi:hypothetical protein
MTGILVASFYHGMALELQDQIDRESRERAERRARWQKHLADMEAAERAIKAARRRAAGFVRLTVVFDDGVSLPSITNHDGYNEAADHLRGFEKGSITAVNMTFHAR